MRDGGSLQGMGPNTVLAGNSCQPLPLETTYLSLKVFVSSMKKLTTFGSVFLLYSTLPEA